MWTQCTSVTDGRTDGRTDRITITKTVQRIASLSGSTAVLTRIWLMNLLWVSCMTLIRDAQYSISDRRFMYDSVTVGVFNLGHPVLRPIHRYTHKPIQAWTSSNYVMLSVTARQMASGCCLFDGVKIYSGYRCAPNAQYTPPTPTRRDKTVSSRRRRRCVLGLMQQWASIVDERTTAPQAERSCSVCDLNGSSIEAVYCKMQFDNIDSFLIRCSRHQH